MCGLDKLQLLLTSAYESPNSWAEISHGRWTIECEIMSGIPMLELIDGNEFIGDCSTQVAVEILNSDGQEIPTTVLVQYFKGGRP